VAMAIRIREFFIKEKALSSSIIIFIIISIISPYFFTFDNMRNLLVQISVYGIVALGMTFAIVGGEFDLAVGSMLSMSAVLIVGLEPKLGLGMAIIVALSSGLLLGLINGLLVSKAKINSFIVTFGSMVMVKGLALTYANGRPIISKSSLLNQIGDMKLFNIPIIVFIFILLLALCHYVLTYSRFGRNMYAIGGNSSVASATGINVNFYKCAIFVITGFFAAIVGILLAARLNTGSPTQGDDMTLTVIASVVLGGTSLSGGKGGVLRTLLGLFIIMFLTNAFDLLGIQPYMQKVIKGMIIISIVAFDSYNKKRNLL
jgi:ribose transport system permease protein